MKVLVIHCKKCETHSIYHGKKKVKKGVKIYTSCPNCKTSVAIEVFNGL